MNKQNQSKLSTEEEEIDLLDFLQTLLDGKWLILFFSLLGIILAFIYAFGATPVYKADALLQVESQKAVIPGIEDITGLGGNDVSVGTEIEIIKSRKIIGNAIDSLKLDITAKPKRVPLLGNLYNRFINSGSIKKPPKIWQKLDALNAKYAWGNEKIIISRLDIPSALYNEPLTLTIKPNNRYEISYNSTILVNGKVNQSAFSSDGLVQAHVSFLRGLPGTQFILTKWARLNAIENLQSSMKAVEKGKKTGIINLTLEGENKTRITRTLDHISNTYLEQNKSRSSEEASNALKFLEEQIKPVREAAEIAEANLKSYRTVNQTADMSMETQAVLDVVSRIDTELQKLSLKKDELGQKYTPNHPTIQAITSQQTKLKQRKERTLKKISNLPETQQEILKLERDYKVANSIYIDLLNKIQEFKIAKASNVGNVYIVDKAVTFDTPVRPQKIVIIILGLILGALVGIMVILLRKVFHRTINNPEKLEEMTGIPVYATVPLTKNVKLTGGLNKKKKQKSLLAIEKPEDAAIESLRSLRTSLHFALLEAKNNIVMITGPSPGVGKSFISSNFAAIVASSEQRVVLIDADMRKGYLNKLFGLNNPPGLSDLISGNSTLEDAIHTIKVGDHSLDVITRGQTPPNPSELLMHSNFKDLLNQLSKQYDLVLIDTPPIHVVTDPTIIGKHSGVVFMVIRSDQHSIKEINHAITHLAHTGIKTKGFIFNGYSPKRKGYDYYSYYEKYQSEK